MKISVLIPVASPAPYLREALASVLAQSYGDWTVVLVNDGDDPRVRELASSVIPSGQLLLVPIRERRGLSYALNRGIDATCTELVARLDADDVAHPERLSLQVRLMTSNPSVVLSGMSARLVDERGREVGHRMVAAGDVKAGLVTRNQLVHPSVIFRKGVVTALGGYDEQCHLREDYDLWLRMARRGDVRNLVATGIDYRLSPHQVSRRPVGRAALRIVGRSRAALGRDLGMPRSATWAKHVAWSAAQRPALQTVLARVRSETSQ